MEDKRVPTVAEQIKIIRKLARKRNWIIENSLNKDKYNFFIEADGFRLEHVQYNEGWRITEYWRLIYKDFEGQNWQKKGLELDFKGTWQEVINKFVTMYNEYVGKVIYL